MRAVRIAALGSGVLVLSAAISIPAGASHSAPAAISLIMPSAAYQDKDQLSDQPDGADSVVDLTALASTQADNVTFFVCPDGQSPLEDLGSTVARNAGCDDLGTDPTGVQPGLLDAHGEFTSDEAYEVSWGIPRELDGEIVDVFALACLGSEGSADVDPGDGIPDNCRMDTEEDIYVDDSAEGDDLVAGQILAVCTTPGSGGAIVDPDDPGAQDNRCFERSDGRAISVTMRPFREDLGSHGGIVPDDGFTVRFSTSPDVDEAGACLAYPVDADDDPVPPCVVSEEAVLEDATSRTKRWVVAFSDAAVPVHTEIDLAVFASPQSSVGASATQCAADFVLGHGGLANPLDNANAALVCVLDEHYIVSEDRHARTVVATFGEDGDPAYDDDCTAPRTEAFNQIGDAHAVYACFLDQFGDPHPALGDTGTLSWEAEGPEGSGITTCIDGISHDHDLDRRSEHCHQDASAAHGDDRFFEIEVDNFSGAGQDATPGAQSITVCLDDEAADGQSHPGPAHGCETNELSTVVTKHWFDPPDQTRLVFWDPSSGAEGCLDGDTFRENRVGDLDDLLVCTVDADGNLTGTQALRAGTLEWMIVPAGAGGAPPVRFAPSPPTETGVDGSAFATIESVTTGNAEITVCLRAESGGSQFIGDGDDCSSVQKRVAGGVVGPTTGPCAGFAFGSRTAKTGGGEIIVGTPGNDALVGTSDGDTICGLEGEDSISGGSGADLVVGGVGADTVRGGDGDDTLLGLEGNDALLGRAGNDLIRGGLGVDSCRGGIGVDRLRGCEH